MRAIVYLAGGIHSGWQDRVVGAVPQHRYINPAASGCADPRQYTAWDLAGVRSADIVFAYFEAENPSGYGLCLEIGYGKALGKTVVFVDEKSAADPSQVSRLAFIREASDVVFTDLQSGLAYLSKLASFAAPVPTPDGAA